MELEDLGSGCAEIEGKNIIHILEGEMGFQDLKMDRKHRMYLSFIFAPFSLLKL